MTSFEFNKFSGAFLATVFVLFSVFILSDIIFFSPVPKKSGYSVSVAEKDNTNEKALSGTVQSVLPLLSSANIQDGEAARRKCMACHTFEKDGVNKVGPNLWNIINRPIASKEGFSYSTAMKNFSDENRLKWDYETLDGFLTNPKGYIKGTIMVLAGITKIHERANLIAYLRTLSDNPAALPATDTLETLPQKNQTQLQTTPDSSIKTKK